MGRFCDHCENVLTNDGGRISVDIQPRSPTNEELTAVGNAIASGAPVPDVAGVFNAQKLDFCSECAVGGGLTKAIRGLMTPAAEESGSALTPDELDALGVEPKADTEALPTTKNRQCPNCRRGELIRNRWSCECTIESRESAERRDER